jgi:hypothetical protein
MEMVRWRKEFYKSRGYEKARKGIKKPIRSGSMIEKMIEIIPADHHKFRTVHPEKTEKQMKETEKERWDMEI